MEKKIKIIIIISQKIGWKLADMKFNDYLCIVNKTDKHYGKENYKEKGTI